MQMKDIGFRKESFFIAFGYGGCTSYVIKQCWGTNSKL